MANDISGMRPQFARCAVYKRYSSRMQRLASLEDQERACREYAAEKGWQILDEHIYSDAALSGTSKVKRKGFQALETAAEQRPRPFDYVLVDDTSRVARKQADILTFVETMRHFGIKVYFVSQKLDSGDEQFDMLLNMYSLIDAQYIKRLRSKVWSAQKGRVLEGFIPGSWPYGYRPLLVMDTENTDAVGRGTTKGTWLKRDEGEAEVIRRIFQMFANGHSMWNICVTLNLEKIPSPRSLQLGTAEAKWSRDAIKRILHNPKYRGLLIWNATQQLEHPKTGQIRKEEKPEHEHVTVDAPHLRIVSDELWAGVQARLTELSQEHQGRILGGYNRAKNKPYLYSGLLFCAICKSRMKIGGKGQNAVYECPDHRTRRGCHNALRIRQDRAAAQISDFLARQVGDPEHLDYLVSAVYEELKGIWRQQCEQATDETLRQLEEARRDCGRKIDNLEDLIADTRSRSLIPKLEALKFDKERTEDRIRTLKSAGTKNIAKQELLTLVRENVASLLEVLNANIEEARQVLQRHIKKLYLYPSESDAGPSYVVTGEIDLFNGPNDPEIDGVLLGCSSTRTSQQHTDRLYRFIFEIDPRLDLNCPLLEPFCQLLRKQPELADKPRTPKEWSMLLREVISETPNPGRPLKSGAVGWCLNNHRTILARQLNLIEIDSPYTASPLYQLSLRPEAATSETDLVKVEGGL